jgi:hypothetical protein
MSFYFFFKLLCAQIDLSNKFFGGVQSADVVKRLGVLIWNEQIFHGADSTHEKKFLLFLFTPHGTYGRGRKYGQ